MGRGSKNYIAKEQGLCSDTRFFMLRYGKVYHFFSAYIIVCKGGSSHQLHPPSTLNLP